MPIPFAGSPRRCGGSTVAASNPCGDSGEQFVGNGYPEAMLARILQWSVENGCDTIEKVNQIIRDGNAPDLIRESVAVYDKQLDDAVADPAAAVYGDACRLVDDERFAVFE